MIFEPCSSVHAPPVAARHAAAPARRVRGIERSDFDAPASTAPVGGASANLLAALLDQIECGLIACDAQGRITFANSQAQAELDSGHLLQRRDALLRCAPALAADQARLSGALRAATMQGKRQLIALQSANDRLLLSVVPVRADADMPSQALVLSGRRSLCSELGLQMLATAHGLTAAESRVLGGLLAERRVDDIARDAGVAIATVRTQINSLRGKLGARDLYQVLVRLGEVPPITGALRAFSRAPRAHAWN